MDRRLVNQCILEILKMQVEKHPTWRFHQLLQNFGVEKPNTDQFYEESDYTLRVLQDKKADR